MNVGGRWLLGVVVADVEHGLKKDGGALALGCGFCACEACVRRSEKFRFTSEFRFSKYPI